ncbi:hypothetical protein EMCRGX_G015779 [Ephydatia muelleri]
MGSAASAQRAKTIYIDTPAGTVPVVFSSRCSTKDLRELLTSVAGLTNTSSKPYKLHHLKDSEANDREVYGELLTRLSDDFTRAFKIHEYTAEFSSRIERLEKRLEVESLRNIELDQYKKELQKLQSDIMNDRPTKLGSDMHPRCGVSLPRRDATLYPKYILTQETINYLKKPTFDIWHWEPNEMLCLLEHMYTELGLVSEFNINPVTLRRWLVAIQKNYRDNPFHNFRHCFCVTQMMYGMIHLCHLQRLFSSLEIATLMTAALCHDLDHPGFNNNYQINARTELAIRYNDISPLENHHCAMAFQILDKPENNIYVHLSVEQYKQLRAGVIELILATDMAKHSGFMETFKKAVTGGFDSTNDEHKKLLKVMLIKCCDISNEVRPMEVSEPWVDCLLQEYFRQSDREKLEGLPVAPFMDRDKVTKATAQTGFIKFVLIPLFEAMKVVFPALDEAMLKCLRASLEHYEHIKIMEDMLKEEEPTPPTTLARTTQKKT